MKNMRMSKVRRSGPKMGGSGRKRAKESERNDQTIANIVNNVEHGQEYVALTQYSSISAGL